jgi:hypothetical protein
MKISSLVLLALLVCAAASANADVTVSSPANGAQVGSPFTLNATASPCSSQPVSAMGYSFDNSPDTTIVNAASINTQVASASGVHTLHVKSWGTGGSSCTTDVSVNVGTGSNITVATPANGAQVATSFQLSATATFCASNPVGAMGYSIDNSPNTTIINSTSINTQITLPTGRHTMQIKSWGQGGGSCPVDLTLNVVASASSSNGGNVMVSAPSNNAQVTSPFQLTATASVCSSNPVSAMGYSMDNSPNTTIINDTSINTQVSSISGAHTLHVKSWGTGGGSCTQDVPVIVVESASSLAPADAIVTSGIQALNTWIEIHDPGTQGTSNGSMDMVNSPSLSGQARSFTTSFTNNGGELYYGKFGADTAPTNFLYEAYVYISGSAANIANLEMDMNQTMPNGQTVIFGFQCDGWKGTWDYTANAGTPQQPVDTWIQSQQPCNPRAWSVNTWHHVQVTYSRDDEGAVTYQSVWLDGVEQDIYATVPSAFALGWDPALITNFQVDGYGSGGTATVYLDNVTVSRW